MRILQITSHLEIGGITNYVLSLSEQLIRRGHHVSIASDGGQGAGRARAMGASHWQVPLHTSVEFSPQVFRAGKEIARRLRSQPADLMHAHTRVGQVVAAQVSRRCRIPYVTTWHGIYRMNPGRWLWPCTGLRTIAISEPVRQHLIDEFRVPEERIRLVWNGVDVAQLELPVPADAVAAFRLAHRLLPGAPVVGGLGRLAAGGVKGFDLILGAAAHARARVPDLQVLIAGDGPGRTFLEAEAARLGLQSSTRFIGATEDVRLVFAALDVFVFPARWPEGFGLALIEAMAAGKPVIGTRVGAVPNILDEGRCGVLVNPEDTEAIGDAVVRLLADRQTVDRFTQAAKRRVHDMFSLEHMTDGIEAVYREVLDGAKGEGRRAKGTAFPPSPYAPDPSPSSFDRQQ
jgi:glycosyltransferase involved in cell wall biosynthesis